MTTSTIPTIYISAMESHVPEQAVFESQPTELLIRLSKKFNLFWKKEWRDYAIIEQEISSCNALLAIVDKTWLSSTWMASEVTWANGQCGISSRTANSCMKPIPIFAYSLLERRKWGWLESYSNSIILDHNIETAVTTITKILSRQER